MEMREPNDISLDELSDRHPDVKANVDEVEFEFDEDQEGQEDILERSGKTAIGIARDVVIGIIVGIVLLYLSPYLPAV